MGIGVVLFCILSTKGKGAGNSNLTLDKSISGKVTIIFSSWKAHISRLDGNSLILNLLKACYFMKVSLVDLSTHGGKIKFEFGRPAQQCLDSQNSNSIFPPYVLKSTRPTFIK